jgi:signal transduction histidine kinase
MYDALGQQMLLAARGPSRMQRRVAYGVMACLLAVFCITAPYASLELKPIAAFVPIYATLSVFNDLITAILILAQFWVGRWTWLLVLANGYLFTALMTVSGVLSYPGVFAPTGVLGGGFQATAWIGTSYQFAQPIFLIAAVLLRDSRQTTGIVQRSPGLAITLSIALVTAITCGLTWGLIAYDEILPRIFVNSVQPGHNQILVAVPIMALEAIALLLLWRRGHSVLDLWLMVVCCAWLFELALSSLFAGSRFSLGWYGARTFQVAATFSVLLMFLCETVALYANMLRTSIQRRGARQVRQIAMDAMAASIGHEIKQPLTAMLTNASACVLQLEKAEPDLEEMRTTVTDIAAEARRIAQIISGVRTMFTESTHDRQRLNLNSVVRDVLSTVELELRHHRVIVNTELDNHLPSVLGDGGQLHQVFLNLITNAMEAMTGVTGRPAVLTVRSSIMADSSDIAVTVEDTGIGIADKDSARIFEPFFSTKAAGTGVGLAVCRIFIEAHGGRLEVTANRPYGAIFRVILPAGGEE